LKKLIEVGMAAEVGLYSKVVVRYNRKPEYIRNSFNLVEFQLTHSSLVSSTAMNAVWGMLTLPTFFIRSLPFFWASSSLRLRLTSPP